MSADPQREQNQLVSRFPLSLRLSEAVGEPRNRLSDSLGT